MKKQKVLITGASKGIGAAIAKALVNHDFEVYGTSRSINEQEESDSIQGVKMIQLDLNDEQSIINCAKQVGDIDILINNAGCSQLAPLEEVPIKKVKEIFQVNLFGLVQLTQQFIPHMKKSKSGVIINIGSFASRLAMPLQSVYASSKYALDGLSWSLRLELAPYGVKVAAIQPYAIKTEIKAESYINQESSYRDLFDRIQAKKEEIRPKASEPIVVVEKVLNIVKGRSDKPFYACGGISPALVILKKFIPEKWFEKILKRYYEKI